MYTKGLISIIIPIYNVEDYLSYCLDSVTGQTYDMLEIICVDDESPDNSAKILESYAARDGRIKIIHQKNTGLSGARNTGIKAASGEYIMFVDADDWIETYTAESMLGAAGEGEADVVLADYVREFEGKSLRKHILPARAPVTYYDKANSRILHRRMAGLVGEELRDPLSLDSLVTAWGKLYRTQIIKENAVMFVDTKIIGTEDALFNLYYFGFVNAAAYIDKPLFHYRKENDTSLTNRYKPRLLEQWNCLYGKMEEYIRSNGLSEDYLLAVSNRAALSIMGLGLYETMNPAGIFTRIKNLRKFTSDPVRRRALKAMPLRFLPLHWRVYYLLARWRMGFLMYLVIWAAGKMRG